MLRDGLPDARSFDMPTPPSAHVAYPLIERLRLARRRKRLLWRNFQTLSLDRAWQDVAERARAGDIVTGHIRFGDPMLPGWRLNYITCVRDPVARVLSDYNYARLGYQKRGFLRRLYHHGQLMAAGRYDFSGYLAFLDDHRDEMGDRIAGYVMGSHIHSDPAAFIRDNYFHIGVLERLDQFCTGLGDKLNTRIVLRHDNKTERNAETMLRAADRPIFERVFARDIAVYEAVRALPA